MGEPAGSVKSSDRPWLSVIMPTYDGADTLALALASVQAQDAGGIEVLAVDDGSTDATIRILKLFAHKLPIQIIELPHSGNWVANANHALGVARGEWCSFLHQDDGWLPGRLSRLRCMMSEYPKAQWFLHPSWYAKRSRHRVGRWTCPLPAGLSGPERIISRLLIQNFISMPAPLFRLDVARAVGGLDSDLWYTADWDFWLKLAAHGPAAYTPRPLSWFGIHESSQTVKRSQDLDQFRRQLETVLDRHLEIWERKGQVPGSVRRAAIYSIELNTSLAGSIQGKRPRYSHLLSQFGLLGPAGWWRYGRDSRIVERVVARVRAGMH